jgi:hypothetical protein
MSEKTDGAPEFDSGLGEPPKEEASPKPGTLGVTVVRPMHDTKAERERFEAAYEAIPPITPTKETAWRIWNMARAYGLIAAPGVTGRDPQTVPPSDADASRP